MPNFTRRCHVTAVLAMSIDGKISDSARRPARFPSEQDQHHLQTRVAEADATLFGAGTLRAYGTTLTVSDPMLLAQRQQQARPRQPIQIVCSASGQLDANYRFFTQPIPRWLLTTPAGAAHWPQPSDETARQKFDRILPWLTPAVNWPSILQQLEHQGIQRLLIMGGGQLVAALVEADIIDELWVTVCPLLIGGQTSPTPMDGPGLSLMKARHFHLLSAEPREDEVFLHYRRQSEK